MNNDNIVGRAWLYVYMLSLIIPTIFAMYITAVVLEIFIPITGRIGSNRNPDDYIGVISAIGCLLITSGYVNLLTTISVYFLFLYAFLCRFHFLL